MGWFEDRRRKEEDARRRRKPDGDEKRSGGIVEPSSEELLERKEKRLQERREGADEAGDLLEDLFFEGEPELAGEPEPVAPPDEEVEVPDVRESLDVVEAAGRETDDFLSEMEEALAVPEFGEL